MNYKIINRLEAIEHFIQWLPDLQSHEQFYGCLFARKKYAVNSIVHSSDKTQLKRFTFTKDNFVDKLRQLECGIGSYILKGTPVEQESLVLYVNPNPRDLRRATFSAIREFTTLIEHNNVGFNPMQEVLSCIQRSKSRTFVVDFDFDLTFESIEEKTGQVVNIATQIIKLVNTDAITFLETRGGLHVLIQPNKVHPEFSKTWYKGISSLANLDQSGDQLLPVPGTIQGGFVPQFLQL